MSSCECIIKLLAVLSLLIILFSPRDKSVYYRIVPENCMASCFALAIVCICICNWRDVDDDDDDDEDVDDELLLCLLKLLAVWAHCRNGILLGLREAYTNFRHALCGPRRVGHNN